MNHDIRITSSPTHGVCRAGGVPWSRALVLLLNAGCSLPVLAQPVITNLGVLPDLGRSGTSGVSTNGLVVVGACGDPLGHAFRWTSTDGMQDLGALPTTFPFSWASGVSDGGDVVACTGTNYAGRVRAARWTPTGGMQDLGTLVPGNFGRSRALDVSADGSVVVGDSSSPDGNRAIRWTIDAGMQPLPISPDCAPFLANSVSADGSVIVGDCGVLSEFHAFRLDGAEIMDLGVLPGTNASEGLAVSSDGSTVVGHSFIDFQPGRRAFRWTSREGMQDLGTLDQADSPSPGAVSGNGAIVVGYGGASGNERAFLWTHSVGMVDLRGYLAALGTNLTGWSRLSSSSGISDDGTTIVGAGYFNGENRAWIVTGFQPPVCAGDFNVDGVLNSEDFFDFLVAFFVEARNADLNHDGVINSQDFFDFLVAFFAGC